MIHHQIFIQNYFVPGETYHKYKATTAMYFEYIFEMQLLQWWTEDASFCQYQIAHLHTVHQHRVVQLDLENIYHGGVVWQSYWKWARESVNDF